MPQEADCGLRERAEPALSDRRRMLGPAKADTPRASLGDVGVSVEEAKAKGGSTVMGRRVESSRVSTQR